MNILETLSKEQLIELVHIFSKNMSALDGVWFQSVESKFGMDEAMYHDCNVWKRYSDSEGKRIKKFLKLSDHPGVEGLKQALAYRFNEFLNDTEIIIKDNTLIYRVNNCRVQTARSRKGMPFHPCLSAGLMEYTYFALAIDDRFICEPISCYPQVSDPTCACAWKFTLDKNK